MLLGYFVMLPDDYENLSQSVIATIFFGNNILSAITVKDYWNIANEYKPLMHTWYVGIVMQFYIVYPILFYLAKFDKKNTKRTLLLVIGFFAIASLLIYFFTTNAASRFYYLPSRFFEFAVGGVVALTYNSNDKRSFKKEYAYVCYAVLLSLLVINVEVLSSSLRLVAVVALSSLLLCSQEVLENRVTGNALLAKIGAASYSIFIWHQILLAFYRYTITNKFTIGSYVILLVLTVVLSWLSYQFVEQKIPEVLKTKKGKQCVYLLTIVAFALLTIYSGYIYIKAGVVRDIPELGISKTDVHRGMHAEYCDRGYLYDRPFETDKPHWLIVGNSYGRDIVNIIEESDFADKVEVSYITVDEIGSSDNRFKDADFVIFSVLGLTDKLITEVEDKCTSNGLDTHNLLIIGERNFGESNGQVYIKRHCEDYFEQYVKVEDYERYIVRNREFAGKYGERYVDMMDMVVDDENKVRVFTPDHHYISADCYHLTKSGAKYYAQLINLEKYVKLD